MPMVRVVVNLWWTRVNFVPFLVKMDKFHGFPAFPLLFCMKNFYCVEFCACKQISKEKPICILLHVFDGI